MKFYLGLILTAFSFFSFSICANPKMLIFCDVWNSIGGTEEVINQISSRLILQDIQVKKVVGKDFLEFYLGLPDPFGLTKRVGELIQDYKPDKILVVSVGLLANAVSVYCKENQIPFSIFYSTKVPEFNHADRRIPLWVSYSYLDRYLPRATNVFVPTHSVAKDLDRIHLNHVLVWPHGADTVRFTIYDEKKKAEFVAKSLLAGKQRPFYLYVGRLCKSKNIDAFLNLSLPGTKILLGPAKVGYDMENLKQKYPNVVFPGMQTGSELKGYFASSDVFVFPSKNDTFGLVQLEALASGLPVVAFDVTGPRDVVPESSGVSYLASDQAAFQRLAIQAWEDKQSGAVTAVQCRAFAQKYSWDPAVTKLIEFIPTIHWEK